MINNSIRTRKGNIQKSFHPIYIGMEYIPIKIIDKGNLNDKKLI